MLTFLYPRMDYNVSTSQNHLLKLPFSIHPTSHKVSVPIFPRSVRDFDPDSRNIKFETLLDELRDLEGKCNFWYKKDGVQNLSRENAMLESPLNEYIRNMRDFIEEVSKDKWIIRLCINCNFMLLHTIYWSLYDNWSTIDLNWIFSRLKSFDIDNQKTSDDFFFF